METLLERFEGMRLSLAGVSWIGDQDRAIWPRWTFFWGVFWTLCRSRPQYAAMDRFPQNQYRKGYRSNRPAFIEMWSYRTQLSHYALLNDEISVWVISIGSISQSLCIPVICLFCYWYTRTQYHTFASPDAGFWRVTPVILMVQCFWTEFHCRLV